MLKLIIGPMMSGKTTALIDYIQGYEKVLVIKSKKDVRTYGKLSTHNPSLPAVQALCYDSLEELSSVILSEYNHIAIDEGQFFQDLPQFCMKCLDLGKNVVVAALDTDSDLNPFGEIPKIMSLAQEITKLTSKCNLCGSDASYTKCNVNKSSQILIGGSELYSPVCWRHYHTQAPYDREELVSQESLDSLDSLDSLGNSVLLLASDDSSTHSYEHEDARPFSAEDDPRLRISPPYEILNQICVEPMSYVDKMLVKAYNAITWLTGEVAFKCRN